MTCLKKQNLASILTIEDLGEILNKIHSESNDWNRLAISVKQKYAEQGKPVTADFDEKPETIYPQLINNNMGPDGSYNKLGTFLKRYQDEFQLPIVTINNFITQKIVGTSPSHYTVEQFQQLFNSNPQLQSLGNEFKIKQILDTINKFANAYGLASCANSDQIEKKLKDFYINNTAQYIYTGIFNESGPIGGETIDWWDFYKAYNDAEGQRALEAKAERNQATQERVFEDIEKGLFADKAIYQEQCFLLSQLVPLIDLKHSAHIPRLPYTDTKIIVKGAPNPVDKSRPVIDVKANSPILVADEPFGFMNRMTQVAHSKKLFDLSTDKISSLVPTIRLYKIETDRATGKDVGFVEIEFDTNPAIRKYASSSKKFNNSSLSLFKNKKKRGVGVGLKGFDFTFHGSDPFAAKKAIQAKMSIFATSFGDLIADRIGTYKAISDEFKNNAPISNYKFADLALKTGKTPEDLRKNLTSVQKDNLDKLNFRLKAVLGWSVPEGGLLTKEEINAVNDSFININLTPTTHEFNFDEMGGVTFTVNYLAYIEDYFNNSSFNIFSAAGIELNRVGRKLFYEFLNNENCNSTNIEKIKEKDATLIATEKGQALSKIVQMMAFQNKVLYYNLTYTQITQFLRTGKFTGDIPKPKWDLEADTKSIREAFETQLDDTSIKNESVLQNLQIALTSTSRDRNKISFFYISDLIDVIMQNIDSAIANINNELESSAKDALNYYKRSGGTGDRLDPFVQSSLDQFLSSSKENNSVIKEKEKLLKAKKQFEKLRIVLGPMEVKDPFDDSKIRFCSIGDIPLSLNYFIEFLTEKMLSKEQAYYPITNFIKDLTNNLINNFINSDGCFPFNTKQRVRLNSSVVSAFARSDKQRIQGEDDLTYFIRSNPTTIGKNGLFNTKSAIENKLMPVLQVSGPSRSPVELLQPDREFNYYIFYAGRANPTEAMKGDPVADAKRGIFHYILGKDRGLVKNITLERTDMTGLKELRFEQEGFDGLTQLREVYNTSIDCFLNPHTFPGTYIYVDPRGFSPEADFNYTQFGIGGYYMITRTEHSIGPGKADTKIIAKWVSDSTGIEPGNEEKAPSIQEEETRPKKCLVEARRSSFAQRLQKELVIDDAGDAVVLVGATPAGFVAKAIVTAAINGDE